MLFSILKRLFMGMHHNDIFVLFEFLENTLKVA